MLSLFFIFGPIFGYVGAVYLSKFPATVYLTFVAGKTGYMTILFIYVPYFWYLLCALIQIWILAIVWSFVMALHSVASERLTVLREPNFIRDATRARAGNEIRFMYY